MGQEDSLEKEMATHSTTLAQKIPWTEEPGAGYCPWGRKESDMTERLHFHFLSFYTYTRGFPDGSVGKESACNAGKKESEKVGLKLNIQKTKVMAFGPITSWEIDEEIVETVADLIFLGSKITVDDDCSHEIKRRLLLGRKVQPRQHIKKQRHYFANKGPSSQGYGFSSGHVWM